MAERQCGNCGKYLAAELSRCPYCREPLFVHSTQNYHFPQSEVGKGDVRRGLLYMLLAGVLYYFAAGYSPLEFPARISQFALDWALPLLFLAGMGLMTYGIYQRFTG